MRHLFCDWSLFFGTRPTILIGRQCPFVRAKVDPGARPWACRQPTRRRAISRSDWWKPASLVGARSVDRKGGAAAVSWSESRGLRRPAHPAPFPALQTQGEAARGGEGRGKRSVQPGPCRRGGPGRRPGRGIARPDAPPSPAQPPSRAAARSGLCGKRLAVPDRDTGGAMGPGGGRGRAAALDNLSARGNPPAPAARS